MTRPQDTGGAAFGHGSENGHCCGATLLDYFAAAALTGILGARSGFMVDCGTDNAPAWAYRCAEEMLAEKRRRESEEPRR